MITRGSLPTVVRLVTYPFPDRPGSWLKTTTIYEVRVPEHPPLLVLEVPHWHQPEDACWLLLHPVKGLILVGGKTRKGACRLNDSKNEKQ